MTKLYNEPVSKLIKLGRPEEEGWLDYSTLGITRDHIPDLIRMVEDEEMRTMEPPADLPKDEELPEWFAQIHAYRALGQLKAAEAVPAILGILHQVDDLDDDWIGEDADEVLALIGPAAIAPLAVYLRDESNGIYARVAAAESLYFLGKTHPDKREECASILASGLEDYEKNDAGLNGFIIYDLVRLKAVEHIALIEKAFESGSVDEMIMGDFEEVQVELGLLKERITPAPRLSFSDKLARRAGLVEPEKKDNRAKKEKNKRKQEKKSRKKNRKRK